MIWRVPRLVLREQVLRQHQRVVHVRAEHGLVPAHVRQLLRLQLARVGGEADDVEAVARELRADQVLQRQRDLLRRLEADRAAPSTTRGRPSSPSRSASAAPSLQTSKSSFVRCTGTCGALAVERVHDRLLEVEVERVAELVGLRVVRALAARARVLRPCACRSCSFLSCE